MRYSEILAKRIRELCELHYITINKLATMAGMKQSSIDNIIHGASSNPTIKTVHRIAAAFGMTVSEFLDFKELNEYSLDDFDDEELTETVKKV